MYVSDGTSEISVPITIDVTAENDNLPTLTSPAANIMVAGETNGGGGGWVLVMMQLTE